MSESLRRAAAPLGLLVVLVTAILLPVGDRFRLAQPDSSAAAGFVELLDTLPAGSRVLVGFDPDIGTYAEIRPTVRAVADALAAREVDLVVVSLTPEGRGLALAERSRLAPVGAPLDTADLGFIPGAEAALVRIAAAISGRDALAAGANASLTGVDVGLVIGGNDIGPRSWVEQVSPRVGSLRLAAISPTILLPEVAPYLESGQLVASIANPRDGAALRELLEPTSAASADPGPSAAAILAGLVIALVVLTEGLARRLLGNVRPRAARELKP